MRIVLAVVIVAFLGSCTTFGPPNYEAERARLQALVEAADSEVDELRRELQEAVATRDDVAAAQFTERLAGALERNAEARAAQGRHEVESAKHAANEGLRLIDAILGALGGAGLLRTFGASRSAATVAALAESVSAQKREIAEMKNA